MGPDDDAIALRSRAGAALIVATVLASMVGFLDAYVVNVAVPAIGRDLGAGVAPLRWTLTGYLVTVAAFHRADDLAHGAPTSIAFGDGR
jgi:hypothetical protein